MKHFKIILRLLIKKKKVTIKKKKKVTKCPAALSNEPKWNYIYARVAKLRNTAVRNL